MANSIKKRINKQNVNSLQPTQKDFIMWDDQLSGFGVRVKPSGAKSYFIQYRNHNGTSRRFTLGRHNPLSPDIARDMAMKELGRIISERADPIQEKKNRLQESTIKQLCDLYLNEGCGHKKPNTIQIDRGRIEKHIVPLLGRKKINELTRADVAKMRDDIANGKTALDQKSGKLRGRSIVTGGKGTASRAVSLLSSIYSFAIDKSIAKENPCKGVKKFPDKQFERYLSREEFKELADALIEAEEQDGENLYAVNAIRLLIFTGCRKSEILSLQWDHVNFEHSCLMLPDSKTGQKAVRIGTHALTILSELPRLEGNPYVFPSTSKNKHFIGLTRVWHRIRSKKKTLGDVRLHDLRHSFASVGVSEGFSIQIVGNLLGHKNVTTTQRYAHLADDPVKFALNEISNQIDAAMTKSKNVKQSEGS